MAAISCWYMLAACTYAGEKPTREAIIAYSDECAARGVQADFIAKFGVDFVGLDLSGVDFSGPHAVGQESNLRGAIFRGANLRGAQFGAAVLDGASFQNADLRDASFITASLRGVDLRGAQLAGASIRESNLSRVIATGVDFANVDITGSAFPSADLRDTTFVDANNLYAGKDFRQANLGGADLSNMWFPGGQFQAANLRKATLRNTDVCFADFSDADLAGASISQAHVKLANFRTARGLDAAQHAELMSKSGLDHFERTQIAKAFFESLWFPLLLVAVIPGLGWVYRRMSKNATTAGGAVVAAVVPTPRFQFAVADLLAAMLLVAVFVGVAMWSVTGLFSLTMVMAGYLIVHPMLYDAPRRRSALWLAGFAGGYSLLNLLVPAVLLTISPEWFLLSLLFGMFIGPLAMILGALLRAADCDTRSRVAIAGFILWFVGIGFANLWVLVRIISEV